MVGIGVLEEIKMSVEKLSGALSFLFLEKNFSNLKLLKKDSLDL